MDKLSLNTEIVSMRHNARKARVHTINKLVRESRKLKNKKGSEEQKKKNQRKSERFIQEVFIIKKLKDDEITKFSLCNTRNPDEILADPAESQKDKALARLSKHSSVSTRVNQFRTKFPEWAHTLPQLLLQLGTKEKKKKKKQKQDGRKRDNEQKKPEEVTKKHLKNSTSSDVDDNDIDTEKSESKENFNVRKTDKEQTLTGIKQIGNRGKIKRKHDTLTLNNDVDSKCETKSQKKSVAKVKRFTELLEEEFSDKSDVCSNSEDDDSTRFDSEAEGVDPFFVYEDGETEYRTSVKVVSSENEGTDTPNNEKRPKQFMWERNEGRSNKTEKRTNFQGNKKNNLNFRSFQARPSVHKKNLGNATKQSPLSKQKEKEVHYQKQITKGNDAPVHPSWEAKKRLKEQQSAMFAFQGKKIKFDD